MSRNIEFFHAGFDSNVGEYLKEELAKWRLNNPTVKRDIVSTQLAFTSRDVMLTVTYDELPSTHQEMVDMAQTVLRKKPNLDIEDLVELGFPATVAREAINKLNL